ncbi:hypothetical protein [Oceanobacillus timonensis]|uniref:hypothetical protein n=1 Tax=Oceanobacillus timonensis TaxID=1926285 RepID=UPI0009B9FC2D|nr:hypothetical protein [Oceanobacillus timonensis]
MKKIGVVLGLFLICFVFAACNNTNETDSTDATESNDAEGDAVSDDAAENNEEGIEQDNEAEEQDYTEEQVSRDYLIYGEWLEGTDLLLHFTRTTDDLTREERLHQSLMESDSSQRNLFSATTKFEVDGTQANLYFNEDDDLSMASTESAQFWEVMNEIGFRYGLDAFNLLNQDGERGLTFAENHWEEPIEIEQEPNRGYYVMNPEKTEQGEHTYISGAVAGEETYTDDEDYYSGIYEGLEMEEAMIDGNQATVKYRIDEGTEASQQEREDFEQVLQLAALDFEVEELKLVNETDQVISVYPLLEETDDNTNDAADNDNSSEDASDTSGQEENAKLTEEDATSNVFDYVDEHKDVDREDVKTMVHEDEDGYFTVQAFVYAGEDDEVQMTNTIGWYLVDKETGKVEEKEFE